MSRQGTATAKGFEEDEIATLYIQDRLRWNTEPPRLSVRILNGHNAGYQLLTKYAPYRSTGERLTCFRHCVLDAGFPGNELNKVDDLSVALLLRR